MKGLVLATATAMALVASTSAAAKFDVTANAKNAKNNKKPNIVWSVCLSFRDEKN